MATTKKKVSATKVTAKKTVKKATPTKKKTVKLQEPTRFMKYGVIVFTLLALLFFEIVVFKYLY